MKRSLFFLFAASVAFAADGSLAATPPMGWNSWDSYGTTVTEAEVKANADAMAAKLKSHGWQYIVVDIQWSDAQAKAHGYRPNAELTMDGQGRLTPAVNRFPSAAGGKGFGPLAAYIHGKGLKFGIHIMRGVPRRAPVAAQIADTSSICRWNSDMYGVDMSKPGGQEYYDSIVRLYAGWGVDYIKADDMAIPLHAAEIEALHKAIVKSGRPIVLSLSPGPADIAKADFYAANANLWRVSGDLWDRWQDVLKTFGLMEKWSKYSKPGGWPDADMLPLGHIGLRAERGNDRMSLLTRDEQQTLMTLWCITRSPLMMGGDLPTSDAFTLSLLTNDEVLAVNQKGTNAHQITANGGEIVWESEGPAGEKYVALFNTGEQPAPAHFDLKLSKPRDLWTGQPVGPDMPVPAHGARLIGAR
ncbi:MAG: glycoside hydrolase family 27 protein [Candidatus Sulfopaludibacter sp.]|nr:glycoside hydrolase family 27 protein [Candidatus Sulfopaludibacter sp.]